MALSDIILWFDYIYWARDRVLAASAVLTPEEFTRDLGVSHRSFHETCVHMFGSERLWLTRWQGKSPTGRDNPADYPTIEAVVARWRQTEGETRAHLAAMHPGDEAKNITYTTLDGALVTYPFWQTALQVTNHSSYHRGQLVAMLRQLGKKGVGTDLIMYFKERNAS